MIRLVRPNPSILPQLIRFFAYVESSGISKKFHPHGFSSEDAQRICDYSGLDEYHVALYKNEVIAYGMLRGWDEHYDKPSLGICVHEKFSGRGVGKSLMRYLILVA